MPRIFSGCTADDFTGASDLIDKLVRAGMRVVGLIDYTVVARRADAVLDRIAQCKAAGVGIAIVDAISNDDLMRLGPALKAMPLVTAGSGVPIGLPQNFGVAPSPPASVLPKAAGLQAVVSGSRSLATNAQVRAFVKAGLPALAVDPLKMANGTDVAAEALAWAALLQAGPVLVYSTAKSAATKAEQSQLGTEAAEALVERTLAAIAKGLVALGVRQLIVVGVKPRVLACRPLASRRCRSAHRLRRACCGVAVRRHGQ